MLIDRKDNFENMTLEEKRQAIKNRIETLKVRYYSTIDDNDMSSMNHLEDEIKQLEDKLKEMDNYN